MGTTFRFEKTIEDYMITLRPGLIVKYDKFISEYKTSSNYVSHALQLDNDGNGKVIFVCEFFTGGN